MKNSKAIRNTMFILALFSYIGAFYSLYKGYDKMNNYENSEYSWGMHVNSYVGGDAYNYIINGTYSSAYYALAAGTLVTGTIFLTGGFILSAIDGKQVVPVQMPAAVPAVETAPVSSPVPAPSVNSEPVQPVSNEVKQSDELMKYQELLAAGVITPKEYNHVKAQILGLKPEKTEEEKIEDALKF